MINKEKEVVVTYDAFQELVTDVAAEVLSHTDDPVYVMLSAYMMAEIARRLFEDEKIKIDQEEK